MKLEHWMQLVFGTALLGTIGFLAINLFDIKGILGNVQTKVDNTESRISRIADALPELKVRVAWEEINSPISGFVTISIPTETQDNKWITKAAVYNVESKNLKIYIIDSDKDHKNMVGYVIAGKLKSELPYESSFMELKMHSKTLQQIANIPANIDPKTSFVIRTKDPEEYSELLQGLAKDKPVVTKFVNVRNWQELSKNLDKLSELKKPN